MKTPVGTVANPEEDIKLDKLYQYKDYELKLFDYGDDNFSGLVCFIFRNNLQMKVSVRSPCIDCYHEIYLYSRNPLSIENEKNVYKKFFNEVKSGLDKGWIKI